MWPFTRKPTPQQEKSESSTIGLASIDKDIAVGLTSFELFGLQSDSLTTKARKLLQVYDGWVYANVKTIAQKVAEMQPKLYQTSFKAGEMVFEEIDDHPLLDLLDKFNPFTTASDAFFTIDSHLSLAGDSFVLKQRKGGTIENLFTLDPTKIKVTPGDMTDKYFIKNYVFSDTVEGNPIKEVYGPEDIIPFKEPNPANPYRGKSPVEAAAQIIDTDTMAGEWNKNFFRNSAVPSSILSTDQKLTSDQVQRVEDRLKRNFGGFSKANKTMILSGGLTWQQVMANARDMEFQLQQQWARDKIMAIFGNTKTSLGIVEDVNRANAEATMYAWLKHTIKPRMRRITDSLNEYLVPEYGDNLVLGFEDPLPEDRDGLVDEVNKLSGNAPMITTNEGRQILDFDPIEGGDEIPTKPSFGDPNANA